MQSRKQRGPLLGVTLLALFLSASLAGHLWMVVLVGAAVIVADFIVSMTVPRRLDEAARAFVGSSGQSKMTSWRMMLAGGNSRSPGRRARLDRASRGSAFRLAGLGSG
jgi:hypothetical protein